MVAFGEALPRIRERVWHDLGLHGLPREKVLATVVQILDETAVRVGNAQYARQNHSYGLTTLGAEHVAVAGGTLHFHFTSKGGKEIVADVRDRRLARIVQRCQELPGHELFQYVDEDGERHSIESSDVNAYLQEISGAEFTAKDFRTWHGTVVAACALGACGAAQTATQARQNVVQAIKSAAEYLGNTPAICRKSYVYPAIVDAYLEGSLPDLLAKAAAPAPDLVAGLSAEECRVLAVLRRLEQAREDQGTRGAA
jgi:DNA topoisomerase-1